METTRKKHREPVLSFFLFFLSFFSKMEDDYEDI